MQEKHLYEYAVLRIVPRVEREEFINAGIILFCKRKKFISVLYKVDEPKLAMLHAGLDIEQVNSNLESFKKIACGDMQGGPIALLDVPERFRWLTAVRSSVIQTSRPHPGLCTDPQEKAEQLYREMVL
ncbi:hypothetical protein CHU92_10640 [Flavobacterium cyanobacteriorum]|uniref:DUF3037 domain-containing protein n=1 Tax=Flavobacterium cyanobacteriorum TaxID=2022802 RepID=A0A255Z2J0_9FLAO|nr:DUF3037 domain-containing protein [Flavobacterium cyanobacteriorum]OYQ35662.1 hypothetical protein CHU92_10640 [Flavobacterium cyanobacteriorum]